MVVRGPDVGVEKFEEEQGLEEFFQKLKRVKEPTWNLWVFMSGDLRAIPNMAEK